ncbi:MAG: TetR/AcrR family transcriptional regulator [Chloroflexota bacterium]
MITKGERTRQYIIERTAQVFSTRGYFGSSMSDLMDVTGMQKGGLYNHFESKDALALAAFEYSVGLVRERIKAALKPYRKAPDRLLAVIGVFRSLIEEPLLPGGCPLLNTAVESDDAHPALRERAQIVMTEWRTTIHTIARKGIERGELRPEIDADVVATILIATLEGAIMMSKLYDDPIHVQRAADYLSVYVRSVIL